MANHRNEAPVYKRGWKMFHATLCDLVLYLHKEDHEVTGLRTGHRLDESYANSIRIHHSMAEVAKDYVKRKFVFRLTTADCAEYLFETR